MREMNMTTQHITPLPVLFTKLEWIKDEMKRESHRSSPARQLHHQDTSIPFAKPSLQTFESILQTFKNRFDKMEQFETVDELKMNPLPLQQQSIALQKDSETKVPSQHFSDSSSPPVSSIDRELETESSISSAAVSLSAPSTVDTIELFNKQEMFNNMEFNGRKSNLTHPKIYSRKQGSKFNVERKHYNQKQKNSMKQQQPQQQTTEDEEESHPLPTNAAVPMNLFSNTSSLESILNKKKDSETQTLNVTSLNMLQKELQKENEQPQLLNMIHSLPEDTEEKIKKNQVIFEDGVPSRSGKAKNRALMRELQKHLEKAKQLLYENEHSRENELEDEEEAEELHQVFDLLTKQSEKPTNVVKIGYDILKQEEQIQTRETEYAKYLQQKKHQIFERRVDNSNQRYNVVKSRSKPKAKNLAINEELSKHNLLAISSDMKLKDLLRKADESYLHLQSNEILDQEDLLKQIENVRNLYAKIHILDKEFNGK